jgi:hypothetical protein
MIVHFLFLAACHRQQGFSKSIHRHGGISGGYRYQQCRIPLAEKIDYSVLP